MIKSRCACGGEFESFTGSYTEDIRNVREWLDRHQQCLYVRREEVEAAHDEKSVSQPWRAHQQEKTEDETQ